MTRLFRSFYARISFVYLGLLMVFCVTCVWIMAQCLTLYWLEAGQRANRDLAANVARELAPLLRQDPRSPALRNAVLKLNTLHPTREFYILDGRGGILAGFADGQDPERQSVSLEPIRTFLEGASRLPIRGHDPTDLNGEKIFSAAPVELEGGASGYLYVILLGKQMELAFSSLWDSYIIRLLALLLAATLLATGAFGAVLFGLLTRRFRRLTHVVRRMKEGEYGGRIDDDAPDEVGQLARAFNEMAATIEAQVHALEQTDELRRTLVADLSHDLRTPLTSTRGYVERMQERAGTLSEEAQQQYLVAILNNILQLERLAGQLNDLSRLDVGHTAPRFESFPVAELVQDIAMAFRPQAEERGIRLQTVDGPELPWVDGDVRLVERALSNLLENALQNTPAGGTVRLQLQEMEGWVDVRVTDTGRGIPADEIPLVPQRFYRAERSRDDASGGWGLGLTISREIAELHGSTLQIRSQIGEGTTVSFRLPITARASS